MAKNYDHFTMELIPDKTLLRLGLHILSTKYLEDRAPCFTKITKHGNIGFYRKVVEKDGKKTVIDLEKEASKKKS